MIGETRYEAKALVNENGEATVKIFGRCSYGEGDNQREVSDFVEITDQKVLDQVAKLLTKAGVEVRDELNRKTVAAAARHYGMAVERGEL